MIRSMTQLNSTRREIERLQQRLAALRKKPHAKQLLELQAAGIRKMIRQLDDQVRLFEDARGGRVNRPLLAALLSPEAQKGRPNFGAAIFILRTARGMTQRDLARRLGTQQEAVARWERDDYVGFSFETLRRIFAALDHRIKLGIEAAAG